MRIDIIVDIIAIIGLAMIGIGVYIEFGVSYALIVSGTLLVLLALNVQRLNINAIDPTSADADSN